MLTLSSLSRAQLGAQLAGDGVWLRTGRFVAHLQAPVPSVADALHLLYADYPLLDAGSFADFHLRLERPKGWRRWFRPQINLVYDGHAEFVPMPYSHAFPMFEWGLNWCVSSRANRYLMIHAAVIERDGCAAILPAPPGSGKSTLTAALVHHGWRLLSDELTLIQPEDGHVLPCPRPISLKNGSIDLMRDYLPHAAMSRPVLNTEKGTVAHLKAPTDSVRRAHQSARPAWIVFPRWQAGVAPQLTPVPRARCFIELAENAFNYDLMAARGFDTMARVIDAAQGYHFTYSRLDDALDVFASLPRPL
ncbi:HprK-related kinase A [Duganella callida]|uniref:HprK-related kinase A n=1 Tax=Duganella callida TaxID=2561932 RepID=A0A4Y9SEU1_9BURK|nr:HprK-related kinase A [Duganella callida]TFW19286.1 HprK-related kinase A [Duganella callida]